MYEYELKLLTESTHAIHADAIDKLSLLIAFRFFDYNSMITFGMS